MEHLESGNPLALVTYTSQLSRTYNSWGGRTWWRGKPLDLNFSSTCLHQHLGVGDVLCLILVFLTSQLYYPVSALFFLTTSLFSCIYFPLIHSFRALINFYLVSEDLIKAPFGRFSSNVFIIANRLISVFVLAGLSSMHTQHTLRLLKASPCLPSGLVYDLGELAVSFFPLKFCWILFCIAHYGVHTEDASSYFLQPFVKLSRALYILFYIYYMMTLLPIPFFFFYISARTQPSSCLASFFIHWWKKHIKPTGFILQEVKRAHNAPYPVWGLIKRQTRVRLILPLTCLQ